MTLTIPVGVLVLAGWLLVLNIIAYAVMASDKRRAKRSKRRVPERTLFTWAAVGGALGIWIAMRSKRHKTQHNSFRFGVPALLLLNIAVYGALFYAFLR
ncbi:DUF1294 domain-containing protein [Saccharibacillus endophyticus]|uniref:DUF1294 domain-containing protein n=1 Tax=Saccharibacillus endophyticus TaxID=2060666 RepID=A0ABQ1ZVL4_9BACL|nr:DUF1294 domain-containing protein [Saccharibacillus endophyticus]GGH78416.1 hypothetical protein GCM10007362_23680 [Saccharibacillus endophyticus]